MNPAFAPALLGRVEDAGINASAPREQLWVDGWLVRFSPGKAKRARCVQAVAAGRLPLEERLGRCLAIYAGVGLRPYFRITPFSQPVGLDEQLTARGMERIDDTRVMVTSLEAGAPAIAEGGNGPDATVFRALDGDAFAEWVGLQRGSSPEARAAHAERIRQSPVRHRALAMIDATGETVAGGQVVVEGELAGLYDIFSVEASRGRGLARALCRQLLKLAAAEGAVAAYLQVEATNAPARRIYERLGFADAYAYHYRSPPPD
ncbi:MAG: GNAT family N-acetyltransferase [Caldimonas sp.]